MKNVIWLIQDVSRRNESIQQEIDVLNKLKYSWEPYGVIPFTENITNIENIFKNIEDDYILRGGTKILKLLSRNKSIVENNSLLNDFQKENESIFTDKLKSSIFYNEDRFDQMIYSKLDLPLLNKVSKIYSLKECLYAVFKNDMFIKPSKDLKYFDGGGLYSGYSVLEYLQSQNFTSGLYDEDVNVVISSVKKIKSEYRFFIVNGDVITGSKYKENDIIKYDSFIPEKIKDCAKEYAKLYQPSNVYTLDLADTDLGVFIVEYNCWNSSGLYSCDIEKIFSVITDMKRNGCDLTVGSNSFKY